MPEVAMRTPDPLLVVRYLDVALVVLFAPFAVLLELPLLGYAVATAVWLVQRAIGVAAERYASRQESVRAAVGINLAALMGRAWLVALTILAVGLAGEREDGRMAGFLMLVAFTVYFATSLMLRPLDRK
jgi:hypothetical protein